MRSGFAWVLPAVALTAGVAAAADWPGWLGPNRRPVWDEPGLVDTLPAGGPKVLWRKPVGPGYSGPAVAGGRVYLTDRRSAPAGAAPARGVLPGGERVLCLDAKTGEKVWEFEYDCPYTNISYPQGPRTTPVVANGRVYTLGTMGDMFCLDAKTGAKVWAKDLVKESGPRGKDAPPAQALPGAPADRPRYAVEPPIWGFSAHLLLDGDRLVTLVGGDGGAVRAFSAATGQELWKGLSSEEVGYAPPVVVEAGGRRQLLVWLSDRLAGLDPATGTALWTVKHPDLPAGERQQRPAVTIVTPTVADGTVFVSTVYEGACAVKLSDDRPGATVTWKAKAGREGPDKLPSLMTTLLHRDGHLYGVDTEGAVRCLKAATGEEVWTDPGLFKGKPALFGSAFWVWVGDRVFALTDQGDLVVCKLTPKAYEEVSRAHVIDATFAARGRTVVWSHPAFADRCMIARNDKEVVCVSLAKS